jgi:hypothetical protein
MTKLFVGRDVSSCEESRQVFLGCENDPRALCFAGFLGDVLEEILRAAELGDAFAQAWVTVKKVFGGRKNLLLKENAMASSGLDIAASMEKDVRKTWK